MSTVVAPVPQGEQKPTIRDRLKDPRMIAELGKAMPDHCKPERMARIALTAITRTPKLLECEEASFMRCMLELSQWGLEPDGRRAHLIPFENRKRGVVECQLIIDYKGLVELAFRSGDVTAIHADVVCDGDQFDYRMGTVRDHQPWFLRRDADKPAKEGKPIAAYCIVKMKDGIEKHEIMSADDIESIRKRSRAGNSGPWVTDWREMAKKTVFRRASKWLPLSADIRDAFEKDDDVLEHQPRQHVAIGMDLAELTARIESAPTPEPLTYTQRLSACVTAEDVDAFEREELVKCDDHDSREGVKADCHIRREELK